MEKATGVFYRSSQYRSLAEARRQGGLRHFETTYGYTSTADSLTNMRNVAECVGEEGIMIQMNVDGVDLPECPLELAIDALPPD